MQLIKTIKSYLFAVARLFLFAICILELLKQVNTLYRFNVVHNHINEDVETGISIHPWNYFLFVSNTLALTMGAYGAFRIEKPKYLLMFSTYFLLYSAAYYFVDYSDFPMISTDKRMNDFKDKLDEFAKEYQADWQAKVPSMQPAGATRIWDAIQTGLKCCGLQAKEDWHSKWGFTKDSFKSILPLSCCDVSRRVGNPAVCHMADAWTNDCVFSIKDLYIPVFKTLMIGYEYYFAIGLLALVVARTYKPHEQQEPNKLTKPRALKSIRSSTMDDEGHSMALGDMGHRDSMDSH